jgi:uncharacterized peroxidase-related enzyme
MAAAPAAVEMYLGMSGALAGCVLPPRVREMIALAVAEDNQCGYCLAAHSAIGKGAGLTPEEIQKARAAKASDPRENAVLTFAKKISSNRGNVTDQDVADARTAGITDQELIEIIAVVSLNLFTNYFNHVADPAIDFPKTEPLRD